MKYDDFETYNVGIDSNIVSALCFLEEILKKAKLNITPLDELTMIKQHVYLKRNFKKFEKTILGHNAEILLWLYQKMKTGDINLVVTYTVIKELEHSEKLVKFMNKNCYQSTLCTDDREWHKKREVLAKAYCKETVFKNKHYKAPMKCAYNASTDSVTPTKDVYIMAECTMEEICLITDNERDFVYDEELEDGHRNRMRYKEMNSKPEHLIKARTQGIMTVNRTINPAFQNGFVPTPIGLSELHNNVFILNQNDIRHSNEINYHIKRCTITTDSWEV